MRRLFALLFGCRHKRTSRAFSFGGPAYCVCFDCGRHLQPKVQFAERKTA